MKVKIKIIPEKIEESVLFLAHRMTPFIQNLVQLIENNPSSHLFIRKAGEQRERKLDYSSILYLEYVERKIFIYTQNDVYEIPGPLYKLEHSMPKYFVRISKSAIVNVYMITEFESGLNGNITAQLTNKEKLIVSRRYVRALKEHLQQLD
ncbi:LytTR family transcriptional regulator [Paenibacillus pasadenensis]|uniref:LytTR family DNA-binding domain-containing protein n=1 Tax=Paenibacillus pasadenensis TaxID=217090 RepID=UPI0020423BB3|nr:LytTR family DNA-binding domain-containing protein [Paenibacillus pasadenensis]MCM3748846.1 LytTR family transcriptional regulator [Paenibacillus pasadenensis]